MGKADHGAIEVRAGEKVSLAKIDPDAKAGSSRADSTKEIAKLQAELGELQQALYAEHRRSLLVLIQAMDTGGKDGAVKALCRGLDPNGISLTNFKVPTLDELDHDFLWRVHHAVPKKGVIGVWNRSHYEDVLVPRVHKTMSADDWHKRYADINDFEKILGRNEVTLLKFFLHISKEEQKTRLEARLQDPHKLWKFNPGDLTERARWDDYQEAYEDVISGCATKEAPWFVVPANRKWARNLAILRVVVATLRRLDPQYPKPQIDPESFVIV